MLFWNIFFPVLYPLLSILFLVQTPPIVQGSNPSSTISIYSNPKGLIPALNLESSFHKCLFITWDLPVSVVSLEDVTAFTLHFLFCPYATDLGSRVFLMNSCEELLWKTALCISFQLVYQHLESADLYPQNHFISEDHQFY